MSTAPVPRRTGVARLVAVLAALVGIAVLEGSPCHAAMSAGSVVMSTDHCEMGIGQPIFVYSSEAMDTPRSTGTDVEGRHEQTIDQPPERLSPMPAGVMMACLAVFLALLAVLVTARLDATVSPLPVGHPPRTLPRRTAFSRKPSQYELCVLRR
ncbi:hypothetical protein ACWZHB_13000 [Nocardia sp. FBN12]|uniref:hypothetical protein n=1 Tax=Nocardia sp. FBN12 TaxID=3419766 RepID=UPI003D03EC12